MNRVLFFLAAVAALPLIAAPEFSAVPAGCFYTGKDSRVILMKLALKGAESPVSWQLDGEEWTAKELIVPIPPGDRRSVRWRNGENAGEAAFAAPAAHDSVFLLDQQLAVCAPLTVRRGEAFELYAECRNRWALPVTFHLTRRVSAPLPEIENAVLTPEIAPQISAEKLRFFAGAGFSEKLRADAAALPAAGWSVTWQLRLPGMSLLSRTIRLVPVAQLPFLTAGAEGELLDAAGVRVVPVLPEHRLGDQRSWELPRRLWRLILPVRRALVAGPDSDGFRHELERLRPGYAVAAWEFSGAGIGAAARVKMLNRLLVDGEAAAIVIPPRALRVETDALWSRYIELLAEIAWSRPSMRHVVLVVSAPTETPEFLAGLRKICRNRDTELIELNFPQGPTDAAALARELDRLLW